MTVDCGRLCGRGRAGPQRIKGCDVTIGGRLSGNVVVVQVETGGRVPEVLVDGGEAGLGAATPDGSLGRTVKQRGEVGHVLLVLEQQSVQADRSELVGRSGERAEAEAGVEPGLAHGAIPAVE